MMSSREIEALVLVGAAVSWLVGFMLLVVLWR